MKRQEIKKLSKDEILKNIDKSKKNISEVCKISEVTINKCFKKIENNEKIEEYLLTIDKS